jgi:hypothetical protein
MPSGPICRRVGNCKSPVAHKGDFGQKISEDKIATVKGQLLGSVFNLAVDLVRVDHAGVALSIWPSN